MKSRKRTKTAQASDPIAALRSAPRMKAPAGLLLEVLKRVGLADSYWRLESPVGPVFVAHSRNGITMVWRGDSAADFERAYRRQRGRTVHPSTEPPPAAVRSLIAKPESGDRRSLSYDLEGLSEFERAVLLKALEIPTGEVRPYSWIAREIGRPEAVRATGTALAKNPIPLLIPCHRVVRVDGSIGRYSLGGSKTKRELLDIEGAHPETLETLAASGVRYLGNETTREFCFPTCGGIESLVRSNKIRFHSTREAIEAGYSPCEACRPAA